MIGAILLFFLVCGSVLFTQFSWKQGKIDFAATQKNNAQEIEKRTDTFTQQGTIADLLTLGKPIVCTYTQNDVAEKLTGSGSVYLDGLDRFRVKSLQNKEGENFDSNIIYTETQMHMWVTGGGRSFATVLPVEKPITTLNEKNDATLNTSMVYESVVYTCNEWAVDESVFTPPSDITFTDMRTLFFGKSKTN